MSERLASLLCLISGAVAISLGVVMARQRLQRAMRMHQRTSGFHASLPEGWGHWFVQGFSSLGVGTRWLAAATALLLWLLLGAWMVSLGIRLVW